MVVGKWDDIITRDCVPNVGVSGIRGGLFGWKRKRPSPRIHNDQDMDSKERRRPQWYSTPRHVRVGRDAAGGRAIRGCNLVGSGLS